MRAADTPVQEATANTPDGENAIGVCIKLRLDCLRTTPEPPSYPVRGATTSWDLYAPVLGYTLCVC